MFCNDVTFVAMVLQLAMYICQTISKAAGSVAFWCSVSQPIFLDTACSLMCAFNLFIPKMYFWNIWWIMWIWQQTFTLFLTSPVYSCDECKIHTVHFDKEINASCNCYKCKHTSQFNYQKLIYQNVPNGICHQWF